MISPEKIAEMLAALKSADAWMHPTADWVHKSNGYVAAHCARGGPRPLPLYQIDPATITEILSELLILMTERDEALASKAAAIAARELASDLLSAAEALLARQREAMKAADGALLAWVSAAEALADQPGMDAHFHDVADTTLDAVDAAKEAAQ
jgi:hypothetical protein